MRTEPASPASGSPASPPGTAAARQDGVSRQSSLFAALLARAAAARPVLERVGSAPGRAGRQGPHEGVDMEAGRPPFEEAASASGAGAGAAAGAAAHEASRSADLSGPLAATPVAASTGPAVDPTELQLIAETLLRTLRIGSDGRGGHEARLEVGMGRWSGATIRIVEQSGFVDAEILAADTTDLGSLAERMAEALRARGIRVGVIEVLER